MELILKRFLDNHYNTTGILYLDGEVYCATLEPTHRHKKIDCRTRINPGKYKVKMVYDTSKSREYKTKYGLDGIPCLQDVPGFEYIYILVGNFLRDTDGCILIGDTIKINCEANQIKQCVLNSIKVYRDLHKIISIESETNITIMDN